MQQIGKILIITGIILFLIGLVFIIFKKIPFGLGKLPGDIHIKKDNFSLYIPITTSIILSVVLSIILFIISKFIK